MFETQAFRSLLGRMTRRDVFGVAAGAGLSFLLPTLETRAAQSRGTERPKSLITLWLQGGISQLESWDPHPASRHADSVGKIQTTVPGLEISELLPQMAEQMHHLSLIRSMVSKEGDHERGTYYVQTGYRPDATVIHPALSAVLAKKLPNPAVEIPQHICLGPDDTNVARGGYLGAELDAFRVYDPGGYLGNVKARVEEGRQSRRLDGLNVVSRAFQQGRFNQVDDTLHQEVVRRALRMMSSAQLKAFELEDESAATREKYGENQFGRGCLVARRLVEQGVRAVQVVLNGFDTHVNNLEGQKERIDILDPAFAALMQDLADRDLLESTIVLCISEFGRTPWLNPLKGRDHWPLGFSCVLGGGGLKSGVVIGETNPDADYQERDKKNQDRKGPVDPIEVPDLYATVLTLMGLDPHEEIFTPIGRPLKLAEGSPIAQLL